MDAERCAIADGVAVLDPGHRGGAEASAAMALQPTAGTDLTGAPAEVAGSLTRTDKPILHISRRHHGSEQRDRRTLCATDMPTLADEAANTFRGLLERVAPEALSLSGREGEKMKEEKVSGPPGP